MSHDSQYIEMSTETRNPNKSAFGGGNLSMSNTIIILAILLIIYLYNKGNPKSDNYLSRIRSGYNTTMGNYNTSKTKC
jgi:hypothetical protein